MFLIHPLIPCAAFPCPVPLGPRSGPVILLWGTSTPCCPTNTSCEYPESFQELCLHRWNGLWMDHLSENTGLHTHLFAAIRNSIIFRKELRQAALSRGGHWVMVSRNCILMNIQKQERTYFYMVCLFRFTRQKVDSQRKSKWLKMAMASSRLTRVDPAFWDRPAPPLPGKAKKQKSKRAKNPSLLRIASLKSW